MRNFIAVILFLIPSMLNATHLIGGELTYTCIGGNQYEIKVVVYRDCGPTNTNGTGFDGDGVVTIYNMNNNLYDVFEHGSAIAEYVVDEFTSECMTIPPELCVEKGTYTIVTTLPDNENGYQIVYQRCCRNEQVINIEDPEDFGSSLVAYVPSSSNAECNSSPDFDTYPPLAMCLDTEIEISQSASDIDGDSLVYSFIAPYHGSSNMDPIETYAPPYPQVIWETGYSDIYPIDSNPIIAINSQTGLITGTPLQEGYYVIGVKVEEYRNGVYLGEVIRDFRFLVIDCEIATSSVPIADIYCEGLAVDFENNSENAFQYYWDFGDESTLADNSSEMEPSYTYPDSGSYQVTLIANPDSYCSDTATVEFSLYPDLFPFFETPETDCDEDATYSFVGDGIIPPSANFSWDFGPNAVVQFSNDLSPTDIEFTIDGVQVVSFTVSYLDCEEVYSSTLMTAGNDIISIEASENEVCEPDYVSFLANTSVPAVDLNFDWDLGDGTGSDIQNPTIQYEPGVYDISLTVVNNVTGCESSLEELAWVSVYPQPSAVFEADQILGCTPLLVSFDNLSTNADSYNWYVDGVEVAGTEDLSYIFYEGAYQVMLQAISAIECTTDDYISVQIEALPEVNADFEVTYYCNDDLEVQIDNTSVSATSLNWSFGDGLTSDEDVDIHEYYYEGVYEVQLVATNPLSCNFVDSTTASVTVALPPEVSFGLIPYEDCQEGYVQFENTTNLSGYDDVLGWEWDFGDGSTSNDFEITYTYFDEGSYSVELSVETDLGCLESYSEIISINFLQNPLAQFFYVIDTCAHHVVFANQSEFADNYFWDFGNGLVSFEENPSLELQPGNDLDVTLLANNEFCSNSISDFVEYSVEGIYENIIIPNVFTPNGDLYNDLMLITGIRDCESAVLRIYNRWGKEVYYSIYPDKEPWAGFYHSEEVVEGVYFYVLELEYEHFTGAVTILR